MILKTLRKAGRRDTFDDEMYTDRLGDDCVATIEATNDWY